MRFKCSMCEHIFHSATAPTACPSCKGTGKARYPKRLPAKRTTHKQRRARVRAAAAKLQETPDGT